MVPVRVFVFFFFFNLFNCVLLCRCLAFKLFGSTTIFPFCSLLLYLISFLSILDSIAYLFNSFFCQIKPWFWINPFIYFLSAKLWFLITAWYEINMADWSHYTSTFMIFNFTSPALFLLFYKSLLIILHPHYSKVKCTIWHSFCLLPHRENRTPQTRIVLVKVWTEGF